MTVAIKYNIILIDICCDLRKYCKIPPGFDGVWLVGVAEHYTRGKYLFERERSGGCKNK